MSRISEKEKIRRRRLVRYPSLEGWVHGAGLEFGSASYLATVSRLSILSCFAHPANINCKPCEKNILTCNPHSKSWFWATLLDFPSHQIPSCCSPFYTLILQYWFCLVCPSDLTCSAFFRVQPWGISAKIFPITPTHSEDPGSSVNILALQLRISLPETVSATSFFQCWEGSEQVKATEIRLSPQVT